MQRTFLRPLFKFIKIQRKSLGLIVDYIVAYMLLIYYGTHGTPAMHNKDCIRNWDWEGISNGAPPQPDTHRHIHHHPGMREQITNHMVLIP